jgi:general secretion pathway protein G
MTLIELLVVLLILSLIAAFAVPRVMKYLGGARSDAAAIQIERLGGILDLYRLDVGRYPRTDEGLRALVEAPVDSERWNGPYLKKENSLIDPWGEPYEYLAPGDHGEYDLFTLGADEADGGDGEDADVTSW